MNRKIICQYTILWLCLGLALSGCIKPEKRTVDKKQFLIETEPPASSTAMEMNQIEGVLEIQRFGIVSRFESKGLVYRISEVEYESDFYNEFLTAPQSMITEATYSWLTQANLFETIVYTDSRLRAHYILEGNILSLYGDFSSSETGGTAVMEIQFFLIDEKQEVKRKLLSGIYRSTQNIEQRTAEDLILSYNRCLENILRHLERDIQASIR